MSSKLSKLKIAVVCSSNMNRSMEAHAFLQKKGFNVDSFGTGDKVKLPGPSMDRPNVYDFGVTYEDIHADLVKKDKALYTQNGILHMLDRNKRIKAGPARLQVGIKFLLLIHRPTCTRLTHSIHTRFYFSVSPSQIFKIKRNKTDLNCRSCVG